MKSVCVCIVLCVALASAYPARDITDLTSVDIDPFGNDEPIVDTGYFNTYYPSLDSFYKRLQDMITSVRERLGNSTSDISTSFGDLGKGNTTSYTKIVGNHKIEVNETEYKKDTDFGTSRVKVSYINVRPLNPEPDSVQPEADTEPVDKNASRDRESLEDTIDNEIANVDEAKDFSIESFDMVNDKSSHNNPEEFAEELPSSHYKQAVFDADNNNIDNDVEVIKQDVDNVEPIRDLSNDIYVNDIMLADGHPLNPDAEYI